MAVVYHFEDGPCAGEVWETPFKSVGISAAYD